MKKLFFAICVALIWACDNNNFEIEGRVDVVDGTKVYMIVPNEELSVVDSTVVVDGKFSFSGGYHTRTVRMLLVDGVASGGPVVLEPGVINVVFDETMSRGGTDGNEILQRFINGEDYLMNLKYITSPAYINKFPIEKAMLDSLIVARDLAEKNFVKYATFAIEKNIDNSLGAYILTRSYEYINVYVLNSLIGRVPLFLRDARYEFVKEYADLRIESDNNRIATSVGKEYRNFELPDVNGKSVLFSNVVDKNNYTLLQFWAGWCAPCRAHLPQLIGVYEKFAGKGFSIVGVSLDSSVGECVEAVSALNLPWLQLCAPAGGGSEVAAAYGVDVIPANVLINGKGVIVARDLSAEELVSVLLNNQK